MGILTLFFITVLYGLQSDYVIDDPPNVIRSTANKQPIGIIDILDEVNIEFDLVFHSIEKYQDSWSSESPPLGSIITIGNNGIERFPALYYSPYSGGYFHFSFSVVNNWNKQYNVNSFNLTVNEIYHIKISWTQTFIKILIRDSFSSRAIVKDVTSHAIVFDKYIYLCNQFPPGGRQCLDASISNLQIMTANSNFNYLCDATNRFSVISGSWTMNDSECIVTQTDENQKGAVVWLGDLDNSTSLKWRNYAIEATLSKTAGNARAGIIFRTQSVSSVAGDGSRYYIGLGTNSIQMGIINPGYPWNKLADEPLGFDFVNGREYTLRIECIDDQMKFYVDGVHKFDINDGSLRNGSIGLRTYEASARYHSLKIEFFSDNQLYTIEPSLSPTNPSNEPSLSPTPETQNPTNNPSHSPPIDPSLSPTNIPSKLSSHHPTSPSDLNEGEIADATIAVTIDSGDLKSATSANTLDSSFLFILIGLFCLFILICLLFVCVLHKRSKAIQHYQNETEMNKSSNDAMFTKHQIEIHSATNHADQISLEGTANNVPLSISRGIADDEFIVDGVETETKGAVSEELNEDDNLLNDIQTIGDEFEVVDEQETCK